MDLSIPGSTTNSPLSTPSVFADNVQDLLGTGALQVNPSAIITVNSIDDALNDPESGVTTLRDAINQANGDNGEDLIVFDRSLFSNQQTITLNLGELDLTHNLDIIAPRDSLTGGDLVTVSGNKVSRVLEIEAGATVSIDGLIVADGQATGDNGGGIKNSGTLTLDSSIVRNNSAFPVASSSPNGNGSGSGIYNSGNLTVNNSTISGNRPVPYSGYVGDGFNGSDGGGISNSTSGILNVNNSTISKNSVSFGYGGGIDNKGILNVSNSTISGNATGNPSSVGGNGGGISNSGTLNVSNSTIISNFTYGSGGGIFNASNSNSVEIINSTLSGNRAFYGGGIYNLGIVTLVFSTLTNNRANQGGGVLNENGSLNGSLGSTSAGNTIIAGNLLETPGKNYGIPLINPDVSGSFTSNGYNLIGDSTGSTGFGSLGDIVGTKDNPIDPRLAPLDFNGGSTQTIALLPDSPAIGAGDPTVLNTDPTTDQRGLPRRAADGSADIGAYEFS